MSVSSATSAPISNRTLEEDVRKLYRDIQDRIREASIFNRSLQGQNQQCQTIYETFQADIAKSKGDDIAMSRIVSIAKRALLDIEWDLDKRITISQIQILYLSILRSINLSPDDDLDEIDAESKELTDISLALAKQAQNIMFRTLEEIDGAANKAELQASATSSYQAFTRIRSSLIKEKTFYQLQTLVEQIIEENSENQELVDNATSIFNEAKSQLFLEEENIVINPEQASRLIVIVSSKLFALAPKGDQI